MAYSSEFLCLHLSQQVKKVDKQALMTFAEGRAMYGAYAFSVTGGDMLFAREI